MLISINISLKFVPKGPINNIPALLQIIVWHRPGGKPLSKPMVVRLPTPICVIWPQWVNETVVYSHVVIPRSWEIYWQVAWSKSAMTLMHRLKRMFFPLPLYNVIYLRKLITHYFTFQHDDYTCIRFYMGVLCLCYNYQVSLDIFLVGKVLINFNSLFTKDTKSPRRSRLI